MNLYIFMMGVIFWYVKNDYFGWDGGIQNEAELICNGIMLLLFALSILNKKKGD